jgi:signal transduction histidine kinase
MIFFHSIRWRLLLWYGLLLLAVLSGLGITAYRLESNRQLQSIDAELQARLPVLVASQRPVRGSGRPMRDFKLSPADALLFDQGGERSFYYVVWLRDGVTPITRSATAPDDVPLPSVKDGPTRMRGELREAFVSPGPDDFVLVGRSISRDLDERRQLGLGLAVIGAAVLLIGLVGGGWLVTRALRPIQSISSAAQKIATGDLTQRISAEDSESELGQLVGVLNSTFARLDTAFTQQARFTADAAHELRTPVTVMLTHTQNGLASECLIDEHREAFEACQRAAQRMRKLIGSLLELARLDAGQEPMRCEPCDLAHIVAECVDLTRPLAEKRGIQLHTDLPETLCHGDSDRLAQVITNLLTNAIDYNHDGGEVRISTHRHNGTATLTVTNTGPGIPEADLPHIFDRFHRADKARSSSGHSGLGLAIAKAIVLAHGGTIEAHSEPGTSVTLIVNLPA